jgi:hypothetical protein
VPNGQFSTSWPYTEQAYGVAQLEDEQKERKKKKKRK